MAIIKCPECGKKVSDEAVTCIHCGYPLAEKRKQQELSGDGNPDTANPSEGVQKRINKKVLIPALCTVAVLAVVLVVLLTRPVYQKVSLPYGLQVGMSKDEAVQKLTDSGAEDISVHDYVVFFPGDFCGVPVGHSFLLVDDTLGVSVEYNVVDSIDTDTYLQYEESIIQMYGKPVRHDDHRYYFDHYTLAKTELTKRYGPPSEIRDGIMYWFNKEEKTRLELKAPDDDGSSARFSIRISAPYED